MIKNIVLDIGGVLQKETWDIPASIISQKKIISASKLKQIVQKDREHHLNLHETGKISTGKYYAFILGNLGLEINEQNKSIIRSALKNVWGELNQELVEVIKIAKAEKKLILSTSFEEIEENAKEKDYLKYFNNVYFSHRIGFRKPDKQAYMYVLNKEGIIPKETLFIDNRKENLKPARQLGIKTLLFTSNKEVERKLKRFKLI